jgi:hypothetical protein
MNLRIDYQAPVATGRTIHFGAAFFVGRTPK